MFWVITKRTLGFMLCGVLLFIACAVAVLDGWRLQTLEVSSTGVRELPIYSVETPEKRIAITFDAAAGASDTDALLGILAAHQVKATFFLCGCWIRNHPEETKKIYNAGHEIGNHGDQHLDPVSLKGEALKKEIEDQEAEMQRLLGAAPVLYRPAYGSYNNEVVRTARNLGYEVVQWSVDSLDWKEYGVAEIQEKVLNHKELKNGAIILFHNDTKYTAQALDELLSRLEEQGYTIGCASELLYQPPYELDHTGRQFQGLAQVSSVTFSEETEE
jgi:polysaccharide deacetylase family sporulation protein PdaB